MKPYRYLFPTVVLILAVLLLGAFMHPTTMSAQDASAPDAVDAALGTVFTYQGNLKKNGQPVNANCSFQFSLWDALNGGAQKATTQIINNTQVQAGSFTVQLDFGNQFTGDARWLQTAVQCAGEGGYTTLAPRQPLNAVPYAIGLRPGAVMQSAAPGDAFYVEKTAANSNAIHGKSIATGSIGVWGEGVNNTGVYGLSEGGKGVWGRSTSESGVFGVSDSWAGVWGESAGASGVVGMSEAQYGAGVRGENTGLGRGVVGISSANIGVYGESDTWAGVWGQSAGASGVVGISPGQYNGGVYGENTGQGYGVYGKSPNGLGVYGQSTNRIGVYGRSTNQPGVVGESDSNDGVRGTATAANHIGVKGVANAAGAVGVWGESATNTGVYGQSGAASGAALWGKNTAGGIALKAEGNAVQSRNMNGLPKAMALVVPDANLFGVSGPMIIQRCYNGVTGQSTGNCGFPAEWIKQGGDIEHGDNSDSRVNFGFNVEDRFIVATLLEWRGIDRTKVFHLRAVSGSQVTLLNWVCMTSNNCENYVGAPYFPWRSPMPFYIVVY